MTFTVAIAGISSQLATLTALNLLQRSDVELRGSCRNTSKLPESLTNSSRVSLTKCEAFDTEALRTLVKGCDIVICCYMADNETMIEGQKKLIDLCEEEGVPRFIASDYTVDYTKLNWGDIVLKDPMKHVKAYLESKEVKGVHILVGLFLEIFWNYLGVWYPEEHKIRFWGTGNEKWELTSYEAVAKFVAAVAMDPEATGVKKFVEHRVSIREIAAKIELVSGRKPTLESAGSLEDVHRSIHVEGQPENPIAAAVYYMTTGKASLGDDLDDQKYPEVRPPDIKGFLERTLSSS